ncbi:hinge domain of cleavage stimulation factor subunit 2-domain-containing protein [Phlebopus sp. FC_14]|nr:hinge domain of cleavage stimulation factor subunit 2-domain-containing protein [Phlebopus sp. FC_14]
MLVCPSESINPPPQDHETAASAVRNLNNVDVGGRPLRIDLADSDPFLEGKTTVRGELLDGSDPRGHWRDRDRHRERDRERDRDHYDHHRDHSRPQDPTAFLASLPPGLPVPPGSTALDVISQTLATMNPTQLVEVLAQMKAFVITHPEQARTLLVAHPQYAYALFQALLLNKIVDQAVLQRMLQATVGGAGPSATAQAHQQMSYQPPPALHQPQPVMPPPMSVPPPPAPSMYQHQQAPPHMPPQHPYYRPPPQPAQPQATSGSGPDLNIDPTQRQMLMQVLSLTPEQINGLPPSERDAIQALRNQFMSSISSIGA